MNTGPHTWVCRASVVNLEPAHTNVICCFACVCLAVRRRGAFLHCASPESPGCQGRCGACIKSVGVGVAWRGLGALSCKCCSGT